MAQAGSSAGVATPVRAQRKGRERLIWGLIAMLALVAAAEGIAMFRHSGPDTTVCAACLLR